MRRAPSATAGGRWLAVRHCATAGRGREREGGGGERERERKRERAEGERERVDPGQREGVTSIDPSLHGIGPEDSQPADGAHCAPRKDGRGPGLWRAQDCSGPLHLSRPGAELDE